MILIIFFCYNVFFVTRFGATPGKMLLGLRIIWTDGRPASWQRALARSISYLASGMALYLGFLMAAFTSEKKAMHDILCATRVVFKHSVSRAIAQQRSVHEAM